MKEGLIMSKGTKIFFVFCGIIALFGLGMYFFNDNNNSVPEKIDSVQRIHIEDCRIVGENGKAVQLTGMSSHGILWYPEYTNASSMKTIKNYGANTFRIAVYSDDAGGGYVQQKDETMRLTYMAIENAISADMYIIVDWHVLNDETPLKNKDSAIAFFDEISSHYGDCPNIIYEICNEPNGSTSWDDIRAYSNEIIPLIRNHSPNSIILVGTPNYSYSVESVIDNPLSFENVMYTFHFYAGQHDDNYYNQMFDHCEEKNIPIFVSEWGINYGVDGKAALSQGEAFAKVLNRRGISWVAWSLSNKNEVFSAIKPDCEKYADWEQDDLTDVGKVFFNSFN